jgi:hypothetical protein
VKKICLECGNWFETEDEKAYRCHSCINNSPTKRINRNRMPFGTALFIVTVFSIAIIGFVLILTFFIRSLFI